MGEELSRRDDFEAIGYTIVYLYTGFLPWQNLWMEDKKERYEKIKEMKVSISNDELCYGCPPEFVKYMEYVKSLEFE